MQFPSTLDIKQVQNHGVQAELLQEFPEFLEVVLIVLDKVLLATCAEEEECLHPRKLGEGGTRRSVSIKEGMQWRLALRHLQFPRWLWLEDTE